MRQAAEDNKERERSKSRVTKESEQGSMRVKGTYVCKNHGRQVPTPYGYTFKATVNDGTASAEFTFFTEAGEKLTGSPCMKVKEKHMEFGPTRFPKELTDAVGQRHIFQIKFADGSQQGSGRFVVNDILDIPSREKKEQAGPLEITYDSSAASKTESSEPSKQLRMDTVHVPVENAEAPGTPLEEVIKEFSKETHEAMLAKKDGTESSHTYSAKRSLSSQMSADPKKPKPGSE